MPAAIAPIRLVLVRHGESTSNAEQRFTGWRDAALTVRGVEQAAAAGHWLRARGIRFDLAFTSVLRRAIATADHLLAASGQPDIARTASWLFNERHLGALQGLTKQESYAAFGLQRARDFRRRWDAAPPPVAAGGPDDPHGDPRYAGLGPLPLTESVAELAQRAERAFAEFVRPRLRAGAVVLVVGHGMALRALGRAVEGSAAPALPLWKLASAAPRCYHLDARLEVVAVTDAAVATDVPDE